MPGTYTVAAEVYDADGNPQVRTAIVQVTDVPALVALPGEDAYSYEGFSTDLEALFKKADNQPGNVIATLPPMKHADVKLWVANVNGKAVVMRSTGTAPEKEPDLKRDLAAKLDPQLRTNVETTLKKLVDDRKRH